VTAAPGVPLLVASAHAAPGGREVRRLAAVQPDAGRLRVRAARCARGGRACGPRPRLRLHCRLPYLTVALADHPSAAAAELDGYMRAYYGMPAEVMAAGQACHAGTLESAAEWFDAYRKAGAQHLVVRLARPGLTDFDDTTRRLLVAARSGATAG
jgi:hypothetical protein